MSFTLFIFNIYTYIYICSCPLFNARIDGDYCDGNVWKRCASSSYRDMRYCDGGQLNKGHSASNTSSLSISWHIIRHIV